MDPRGQYLGQEEVRRLQRILHPSGLVLSASLVGDQLLHNTALQLS